MNRYLSGLCVAGLGLCGGGWLVVAAVAFGGESAGLAGRVNLLTGAGLITVCCLSLVCWSFAWRQRMRVDGVLADRLLMVSTLETGRSRRALGRDVRRAGKLAERSARDARRAARRSARAAGGGMLSGVNGSNVREVGVNRSGGTGVNGDSANGSAGGGVNGSAGDGAGELISQLREMLVPLLAATGSQPALTDTGSQPTATSGEQAGAAGLPRRTPSASAFRPRTAPAQVPRARMPQQPVPQQPARRVAVPAVGDGPGGPVDTEEAWW